MTLRIAPTLSLPIEAATETFGILAKKGAGKSNAAVVMAEEMFDARIPWVAIDPKGDWWGLRSSGDGKKPGLPIVVFGGRHGDIPLEPTAGRMLADLILSERLTCVLDVSEFSNADVTRFLLAFADRLYRQAEAEPLHLFLEEAHEYLPQLVRGDKAPLVGAWQRIVKQGRFKGLGITLISQRSASLNKDVLTQVDTLIVLQTTSPQDRAAVKAWIDVNSDHREALDSLPSLDKGDAWIWSPSFLDKQLQRIKFRRRRTFDSGATPKAGEVRKAPSTLADVDLAVIKEQMADTIEKAKADDPKELRKRIVQLERDAKARPTEQVTKVETVVELVEVPLLDEKLVARVESAVGQLQEFAKGLVESLGVLAENLGVARMVVKGRDGSGPGSQGLKTLPTRPMAPPGPRSVSKPVTAQYDGETPHLRAGARRMLEVLARHRDFKVTRSQLGTLSGFAPKGGTFGQYLGDLKRAGLLVEQSGILTATDQGFDYLGGPPPAPQSTEEILDQWRSALRAGERLMLDVVVAVYPKSVTKDDLAEQTEFTVSGGTFGQYLGTLRRNGLVEVVGSEVTAADTLFLGDL